MALEIFCGSINTKLRSHSRDQALTLKSTVSLYVLVSLLFLTSQPAPTIFMIRIHGDNQVSPALLPDRLPYSSHRQSNKILQHTAQSATMAVGLCATCGKPSDMAPGLVPLTITCAICAGTMVQKPACKDCGGSRRQAQDMDLYCDTCEGSGLQNDQLLTLCWGCAGTGNSSLEAYTLCDNQVHQYYSQEQP
jgi:hypothetical protein